MPPVVTIQRTPVTVTNPFDGTEDVHHEIVALVDGEPIAGESYSFDSGEIDADIITKIQADLAKKGLV